MVASAETPIGLAVGQGRTARIEGPRLLVTGAGGQLGRAVGRLLPDSILLTRDDLDITDPGAVAEAVSRHAPRVVVHAAAWTAVDAAEADPDGAWRVNVGGTQAVARAAASVGALLVYPSTDYVFSGEGTHPYSEHDATKPRSVYGRTKLEGETAARSSPRHLIVRTSWVFGEARNFVSAIIDRARQGGTSLEVVADQIGRPTYALDLAQGLLSLVQGGHTKTFHLTGGGEPCSWADFAEAVLDAAVRHGLVSNRPEVRKVLTEEWVAGRPHAVADRPRFSVLDCSRAKAAGVLLRPWPDALEEFVARLNIPGDAVERSTGIER